MKIIGCMRVKNEARWIERSIRSLLPLCSPVVVFDDHSTDQTFSICANQGEPGDVVAYRSPFEGLNEVRDKNWLLDRAASLAPDWIVWIDGDEQLTPESIPAIQAMLDTPKRCLSFRIRYLWDREDQVRTDGVYGMYARQSMFRPTPGVRFTGEAPGFHTGNCPKALWNSCAYPDATLLHMGYLHKEDRIRKYHWYNEKDPNNATEDFYKHVVQGDIPEVPASAKLMHAGPLVLQSLHEEVASQPVPPRVPR